MHAAAAGNPSQQPATWPDDGPRERRSTFVASVVLREQGLERRSVTLMVRPDYLGFPTDNPIFENIAPIGRPYNRVEHYVSQVLCQSTLLVLGKTFREQWHL